MPHNEESSLRIRLDELHTDIRDTGPEHQISRVWLNFEMEKLQRDYYRLTGRFHFPVYIEPSPQITRTFY